MKITARQLRQIIKEELQRSIREGDETELGAVSMPQTPLRADAVLAQALPQRSNFLINRDGPGSWDETYNAPGSGKIIWKSAGSMMVALKWAGDDGKTFFILQAGGVTSLGAPMEAGQTIQIQPKAGLTVEELTGGQFQRVENGKEIAIPAMLDVSGSPGGGMLRRKESMTLEFTVM